MQNIIVNEIKNAIFFSIITDETRDTSCTEQTLVCIRYTTLDGYVKERFFQFVAAHQLDAQSLVNIIVSCVTDRGLDIRNCASVMSGCRNTV